MWVVMRLVLLEADEVAASAVVKGRAKASCSSSADAAGERGDAAAEEARHLQGPLDGQELGPDGGAVQGGDAVVGGAPWVVVERPRKEKKKR